MYYVLYMYAHMCTASQEIGRELVIIVQKHLYCIHIRVLGFPARAISYVIVHVKNLYMEVLLFLNTVDSWMFSNRSGKGLPVVKLL